MDWKSAVVCFFFPGADFHSILPFVSFLARAVKEKRDEGKGGNQSWFLGHPPQKKRKEEKRMTYQDCIPRPLTSSRIPDKIECWELVFSHGYVPNFHFLFWDSAGEPCRDFYRRHKSLRKESV